VLVLTLTQPWASLVAHRIKRIETRSWRTHYRGPLLIHAAKSMPGPARDFAIGLALEGLISFTEPTALPRGVIVAKAELVDVVPIEALSEAQLWGDSGWECELGDYSAGRFAWLLEKIEPTEHVEARRCARTLAGAGPVISRFEAGRWARPLGG